MFGCAGPTLHTKRSLAQHENPLLYPSALPRQTATVLKSESCSDDARRSTSHVGRASHVMRLWSTFGRRVFRVVDRRRRKNEHSIADRYWCNPSGVRRPCSEHSIADRYFCNSSGVRRPCSEHSIADRYFCNPSGVPKSAGGRPGEACGANPREGWLRRVAGEGVPGRLVGAKMSISWWVFEGFRRARRSVPGRTGEAHE